jgi:hypothetical protein
MDDETQLELCEQATGVMGAGNFRKVFESMGYKQVDVLDWSSSAGDWSFIVSRDGQTWHLATQENAYPHVGFRYNVDMTEIYHGSADQVMEQISNQQFAY